MKTNFLQLSSLQYIPPCFSLKSGRIRKESGTIQEGIRKESGRNQGALLQFVAVVAVSFTEREEGKNDINL